MFTKLPGFISLPSNLISFASRMNSSTLAKSKQASLALGRALMVRLTTIEQGINDPDIYFRGKFECSIRPVIDAINEIVVIDREETMRCARQMYCVRHRIANMSPVFSSISKEGFEDFFQLRLSMDQDYLNVIRTNEAIMGELSVGFDAMITHVTATPV